MTLNEKTLNNKAVDLDESCNFYIKSSLFEFVWKIYHFSKVGPCHANESGVTKSILPLTVGVAWQAWHVKYALTDLFHALQHDTPYHVFITPRGPTRSNKATTREPVRFFSVSRRSRGSWDTTTYRATSEREMWFAAWVRDNDTDGCWPWRCTHERQLATTGVDFGLRISRLRPHPTWNQSGAGAHRPPPGWAADRIIGRTCISNFMLLVLHTILSVFIQNEAGRGVVWHAHYKTQFPALAGV